jgi:hypothetical protein
MITTFAPHDKIIRDVIEIQEQPHIPHLLELLEDF